jgi:DNA-binding SARP family transcriptional activator/Tfp pilus assembly protein PilF
MNSGLSRSPQPDAAARYRLRTLGGRAHETAPDTAHGAASRPRSLALLALLAAAGPGGVPRDKLLLYLWPDSNTQRARNSLHQTLYALRRHLGQEVVLAGIPNLQLNPSLFSIDLWDFDAALSAGAVDQAIAAYGGLFLDGFTLPDLPEFERWVTEERARWTRRYADALEASAAQAGRQGHYRLAVERWQALNRLDPLSTRAALGSIRALAAAGNRAGALQSAKDYEELIRRELGTGPDPAVTALVAELRGEPIGDTASAAPATPAAESPALPPEITARPQFDRTGRSRLWQTAVAILVLLDAIALGAWWWARRPATPPVSRGLVAVFPFAVEGSPQVQYLDSGLVDLLTTNLEGAGEIRSVDPQALLTRLARDGTPIRTSEQAEPLALRFGAGLYVLGNVVESGGRLHLRAALYDREHGGEPVARAAVEGSAAELFGMVDRLTAQLLAGAPGQPRERLARVAATTTGSLEALKSYLVGERELRAGRYVAAMDAFGGAVALDSSFALAHYRLSIAADGAAQDSVARRAAESAARFGGRLPDHDRLLVAALAALRRGRHSEAERLYRQVVVDYPDDLEAWLQLGQLLFQANPLRGRSSTEARGAFERVLALDPRNEEALVHLARIAFIEGRRGEVDALVQRVLATGPDAEVLELRAFRAFALGDREAQKRVTRELVDHPPDLPAVSALEVAVYLDDLDGTERFARVLTGDSYSDDVRGLGYRLLGRMAAARGRWQEAQSQLDNAARFDAVATLELRSLLAVLPFLDVPRAELLAIRSEVESWQPESAEAGETSHSAGHVGLHPHIRSYRLGLLDARLGDTLSALRHAAGLERAAGATDSLQAEALRTFAQSIRARVAMAGGRPAAALAHLDSASWEMVEPIFESEALDRYYRAELLHVLGRDAEALEWYRTIAQRATYEVVYVAPARRREGEIHARMGRRGPAVEAYRTVERFWRDADPPLRAAAAEAGRMVGRQSP